MPKVKPIAKANVKLNTNELKIDKLLDKDVD